MLLRRYPQYARLWFAQIISSMGDLVLLISVPLYVYELTGSTLATGVSFAVDLLPSLLLGPVAGVFVDRWDRRRTMVACNVVSAAVVLPLLLVDSPSDLWIIYLTQAGLSSVVQLFQPARGALMPTLVDRGDLLAANGLSSAAGSVVTLVGPPLGALLFQLVGLRLLIAIDSVSFVVSAALILALRTTRAHPDSAVDKQVRRVLAELREGARAIARHATLRAAFVVSVVADFGSGLVVPVLVPFITDDLGATPFVFGIVVGMQGIGGLVGGLLASRIERRLSTRNAMRLGGLLAGASFASLALVRSPPQAAALIAAASGCGALLLLIVYTALQTHAYPHMLGRVLASLGATSAAVRLLGMGTSAAIADFTGGRPLLAACGVLFALAGFVPLPTPQPQAAVDHSRLT